MTRSALVAPLAAALTVGLLTAVQSRINGSLASAIGGGLQAAAVSFVIGMCALTLVVLGSARLRDGVGRLWRSLSLGELKWWQVTGGVLGGYFVLAQSVAVPTIGVGLFTISLVAGLTVSSLVVDGLGLGPVGKQPITLARVLASGVGVIAVATAVSSRLAEHSLSLSLTFLGFSAGVGVAIQQAFNGRVSVATGQPIVAGWFNFLLGSATLVLMLTVGLYLGTVESPSFTEPSVWLYTGGLIGIIFISLAAWTVGRIGVLRLSLLSVAGQLTGALLLDLAFTDYVDGLLILGVTLAFIAAALAHIGTRRGNPRKKQSFMTLEGGS